MHKIQYTSWMQAFYKSISQAMSSTSTFHNTKLVFNLKIEYKQVVIHIKTTATAKLIRESALSIWNT